MKKAITGLCLALAASLALAATPPSNESIEELLEVTHASKLTDVMVQQVSAAMLPAFEQSIDLKGLDAPAREKARRYIASFSRKMNDVLAEELSWARMKAFSVQVYQETFTQEEIDAMMADYDKSDFKPVSYASAKNTNVSLVQFVMSTDPIEAPSHEEPAVEEPEQGIWDRLLALFGLA